MKVHTYQAQVEQQLQQVAVKFTHLSSSNFVVSQVGNSGGIGDKVLYLVIAGGGGGGEGGSAGGYREGKLVKDIYTTIRRRRWFNSYNTNLYNYGRCRR